jgi:hypothetical protein
MSRNIFSIPKDVLMLILKELKNNNKDLLSFIICCRKFYKKFKCILYGQCSDEIEDIWNNELCNKVLHSQCDNFPEFCQTGCTKEASKIITCSVFPWKTHNLKVVYLHFPRDVDLLTWFEDNKKIGYVIL